MKKIWFNHWFSSAAVIIEWIRKENPDVQIYVSCDNSHSPLASAADRWFPEPEVCGDAYVDYCISFCKKNGIDLFIPRRALVDISRRKQEFKAIGTMVMVDRYETVSILDNKARTYDYLCKTCPDIIPEFCIVDNPGDFQLAYTRLAANHKRICMKFIHDEGGRSFRVIDDSCQNFEALFWGQGARMSYTAVMDALSQRDTFSPLMVMPYLSGSEWSVDCLSTGNGLIMLPRMKSAGRTEKLCFAKDVMDVAKQVFDTLELTCPCNIQFRVHDGKLFLLEINPRMSGGVQMGCIASGVNLPGIAVKKMFGEETSWELDAQDKYISFVEKPILV